MTSVDELLDAAKQLREDLGLAADGSVSANMEMWDHNHVPEEQKPDRRWSVSYVWKLPSYLGSDRCECVAGRGRTAEAAFDEFRRQMLARFTPQPAVDLLELGM